MKAFQAMLACPAGSIRVMRPDMLVRKFSLHAAFRKTPAAYSSRFRFETVTRPFVRDPKPATAGGHENKKRFTLSFVTDTDDG